MDSSVINSIARLAISVVFGSESLNILDFPYQCSVVTRADLIGCIYFISLTFLHSVFSNESSTCLPSAQSVQWWLCGYVGLNTLDFPPWCVCRVVTKAPLANIYFYPEHDFSYWIYYGNNVIEKTENHHSFF